MTKNQENESLEDKESDSRFFGMINDLREKNSSRYEIETQQLLHNRTIDVPHNGSVLRYQLDRVGCTCSIVMADNSEEKLSWTRLGWKKSQRESGLPEFFAANEARLILQERD